MLFIIYYGTLIYYLYIYIIVEGASEKENVLYGWKVGEAFSYRRHAYYKMARILAEKRGLGQGLVMYEEVYSRESPHTWSLHQLRTPPMTQAAREVREAIASGDI